jgi:AcrR family transcriptional regulator
MRGDQAKKVEAATKAVQPKKAATANSMKSKPRGPKRPTGGVEIREALTHAAEQLFLERSPSDVTLREVAAHAGVNYGLVHRYFGSKEALVASVFEAAIPRNRAIFANASDVQTVLREVHRAHRQTGYARTLAWAILEGMDLDVLHANPELIDEFLERMGNTSTDAMLGSESDIELRVTLAAFLVLLMGWDLYEPYLLRITGMQNLDKATLNEHLIRITDKLLAPGGDGGTAPMEGGGP